MPLPLNAPLPSFEGIEYWLNTAPPTAQSLQGKPVLVYFWAVSCHICHENMPFVQSWREKYAPHGLQLIAIHTPRQESDTDLQRIKEQITALQILDPCAADNQHLLKDRFDSVFWPAYFLFDAQGILVRRSAGNAGIRMIPPELERLFPY
jgi:thiol-disulfide isomerase/thioredoxin